MPPPNKPQSPKPASTETPPAEHTFEGDYRPTAPALFHPHAPDPKIRVEPLQVHFLHKLADALNTTLDLTPSCTA
jgi:phosphoserine phosphatase RsbU/P